MKRGSLASKTPRGVLSIDLSDAAIEGAVYRGNGEHTAYTFRLHPGLTLHINRPRRDGTTTRTWYYVASKVEGGRQVKSRRPLGRYPEMKPSQAARQADILRAAAREGGISSKIIGTRGLASPRPGPHLKRFPA